MIHNELFIIPTAAGSNPPFEATYADAHTSSMVDTDLASPSQIGGEDKHRTSATAPCSSGVLI